MAHVHVCRHGSERLYMYMCIWIFWFPDLFREYLLAVLIHLTQELFKGSPSENNSNTLAGNLADSVLHVSHFNFAIICIRCVHVLYVQ